MNAIFEDFSSTKLEYTKKIINPLILAINKKNAEIVKLLLKKPELDVNQIIKNENNESWIHEKSFLQLAVENDCPQILQLLLDNPNTDVNILTKVTPTPNNNAYDYNILKYTPLYLAVKKEKTEMVKILLSKPNIDVNIVLDHKLGKNAFSRIKEKTVLHTAVKKGNIDIVQLLLNKSDLDACISVKEKGTPLKVAIKKENIKIIELLLEKISNKIDSNDKKDILRLLEKEKGNNKILQLIE